jgi:voltage-gated potassium channel
MTLRRCPDHRYNTFAGSKRTERSLSQRQRYAPMDSTKHLRFSILLSLLILFIGTLGYTIIEGWSPFDAFYMTIITISTVGFSEVHQMGQAGRIFTAVLVFFGVGFSLYVAGAVVQFMVEGRMRHILGRRRLDRQISRIRDHYIVCGYGRIGRVITRSLHSKFNDIVVVENNPDLIPVMDSDGVLYLSGNATDETVLKRAGITVARGLIAVLATDTENVFLVLTARQLNPDLYIMARAGHDASKSKLLAAGANQVESPYVMGAINMATKVLRPEVTNFLELALSYRNNQIQMEEIPVTGKSRLVGVPLKDTGIRQDYNVIIIAVKMQSGAMRFNPSFDTVINAGDTVIAVGEDRNLQRLEKALKVR